MSAAARRLLAAAALAAAAAGCDGEPARGAGAVPAAAPGAAALRRPYSLVWRGDAADLPWNHTVYVDVTESGRAWDLQSPVFPPDGGPTYVDGAPGLRWRCRSEFTVSTAMDRILWNARDEGTFGTGDVVEIRPPARTRLVVGAATGPADDPGAYTLTVADPEGGARMVVVRDGIGGYRFALWDASRAADADDWRTDDHTTAANPWTVNEVRAGRFTIGVRAAGRRWLVRDVELRAGEEVRLDALGQPEGGGRVVCEDGGAELLLDGKLVVPGIRIVRDFYRARWEGVPPGRHVVRTASGRREVEVRDGAEVRLPR